MNVTRYNPQRLYRRPDGQAHPSKGKEKFSWKGHALAAGFAVTSVFKEAVHYGQLLVGALAEPNHLSIQDRVQYSDNTKTAVAKHRRTYHSRPNPPLAEQSPLRVLADAHLKRPIMLVPGWDMAHDRFLTLTEKLSEHGPATVYVNNGEFYSDRDCETKLTAEQVSKDSKVFVSVFDSIGESPKTTVPQLEKNMEALKALTGAEHPDMMGYSQGGLAARTYLDKTGERIGKLLMLGTPNLGAGLADASKFMYNAQDKGYAVDWLMSRNNIDDDDEGAMRLMASDSPQLADLNSRWDQQMSQTEGYLVVGAANDRTVHWGPKLFAPGDGLVEAKNLAPKGAEVHLIKPGPWDDHANLPYSASAYLEMHQHFDWG